MQNLNVLHPGPVVPTSVEQHEFTGRRQVGDVTLEVPLRALAVGRGGEGNDADLPRVQAFGDGIHGAALARRVSPFEQHHHAPPGVAQPVSQIY